MRGELQPLLIPIDQLPREEPRKVKFKDVVEIVKALPDGMAKTYATFGPIAILYSPGFWLIAPVITGGVISVSEKTFEILAEHYPENELIKTIAKLSKGTNQILINYFEDFGFTNTLLTTIAAQIGGIKYYSNYFAKIIAPIVSVIPAALVRYARYRHAHKQENSLALNLFAGTMQGANAPTFTTGLLQLQGVIPEVSPIPGAVILASSSIGFFSGLTRKSRPIASLFLELIYEILEDASLATAFFAFPNDIYAAADNDEISDAFFYSNASLTCIYFLMLLIFKVRLTQQRYNKLTHTEPLQFVPDIETGNIQGSDDDDLGSSEPEYSELGGEAFVSDADAADMHGSNDDGPENPNNAVPELALQLQPADSPNQQNNIFSIQRSPSTESFFAPPTAPKPTHRRTASEIVPQFF